MDRPLELQQNGNKRNGIRKKEFGGGSTILEGLEVGSEKSSRRVQREPSRGRELGGEEIYLLKTKFVLRVHKVKDIIECTRS